MRETSDVVESSSRTDVLLFQYENNRPSRIPIASALAVMYSASKVVATLDNGT